MEKNQYTNLLKTILEAYDPNSDPRNYGFPMDALKPWERLIGGDIHDIPGGKEAWEAEQAAKAEKKEKTAQKKKLTAPTDGNIFSHIESNAFSLEPEQHEKAKTLVASLDKTSSGQYPEVLKDIHRHLADSGVDIDHPHMKKLRSDISFEEDMNREKSRARAGL